MQSELTICNRALEYLGLGKITTFQEPSREAEILSSIYPIARDELLERFDFSFSAKIERLARLDEKTPLMFYYIYQIPNECLRIRKVFGMGEYFFADKRTIHSPKTEMLVEMTTRVVDTTFFSALFTEALVCRIASMVAIALTGDSSLSEEYYKKYYVAFEEAQSADASIDSIYKEEESSWLYLRNR